jgi:hypothetical protein
VISRPHVPAPGSKGVSEDLTATSKPVQQRTATDPLANGTTTIWNAVDEPNAHLTPVKKILVQDPEDLQSAAKPVPPVAQNPLNLSVPKGARILKKTRQNRTGYAGPGGFNLNKTFAKLAQDPSIEMQQGVKKQEGSKVEQVHHRREEPQKKQEVKQKQTDKDQQDVTQKQQLKEKQDIEQKQTDKQQDVNKEELLKKQQDRRKQAEERKKQEEKRTAAAKLKKQEDLKALEERRNAERAKQQEDKAQRVPVKGNEGQKAPVDPYRTPLKIEIKYRQQSMQEPVASAPVHVPTRPPPTATPAPSPPITEAE